MAINPLNETEVHRMQVYTKDLLPNPYRRMEKYHLQPERLNALVKSIRDTSFWDNILARPGKNVIWIDEETVDQSLAEDFSLGSYYTAIPDGDGWLEDKNGLVLKDPTFEIAYGHHRLDAVRTCNIKQVNIPVKDLSDTLMVKIMANENQSDWHMDTAVMNETIWAVQDFILEAVMVRIVHDNLNLSKRAVTEIKNNNYVGRKILIEFLGSSWTRRIETALELRKLEDETSENYNPDLLEATEEIKTPSVARAFQKAAKDYQIPKKDYKPIAKAIQKNGKSAREAVKTVRDNRPKLKPLPGRDKLIEKIDKMMSDVDDAISSATNKMWWANQELKRLNVEEIGGLQKAFAMETFSKHIRVMREHMKYFGFTENDMIAGGNK